MTKFSRMTRWHFLPNIGASAAVSIFISGWPCYPQSAAGLRLWGEYDGVQPEGL